VTDQAALIRDVGDDFALVPVSLPAVGDDEVRVRIVATGICHTDLIVRDGKIPHVPMPAILGHEGAGVIEEVGADVTDLEVGDHVVLSFAFCGSCRHCADGRPADCDKFFVANFLDGEARAHLSGEEDMPVNGGFFNQSSFATHSIAKARHAVRVPRDLPLSVLAPLGCGIITGAGTVLNHMRAGPGNSIAVFGVGAVGLSAVMAAKLVGCSTIIAIDRNEERLNLARELGATDILTSLDGDVLGKIREMLPAGADFVLDTTGVPPVVVQALGVVNRRGSVVLVAGTPGEKITLDMSVLLSGASIQMVAEGASVPRDFIPRLIEHYRAGRFPFDRLIRFYDFHDINQAAKDSITGKAIKPVLRMAASLTKKDPE
jgi:aryl-alcohol dehydrogenase